MAFPDGWGRRCIVTIDNTKVPATKTDFPALITEDNLPSEMLDADGSYPALNGGGDIRFTSDEAGTILLNLEVVEFVTDNNPANGVAQLRVKVPSLASATDTDIYVWYNKTGESQPAAGATGGSDGVWKIAYKNVQHLEQDPSGTAPQMIDSTSNGHDGTSNGGMTSGDLVAGQIGDCLEFDGSNDYIDFGDLSASIDVADSWRVSWWEYWNTTVGGYYGMMSFFPGNATQRFLVIRSGESGYSRLAVGPGGITNNIVFPTAPTINACYQTWCHWVLECSNGFDSEIPSDYTLYVDGVAHTGSSGGAFGSLTDQYNYLGWDGADSNFNGRIDGFKLSTNPEGQDWATIEHNNESNPATFATAGTPETPTSDPGAMTCNIDISIDVNAMLTAESGLKYPFINNNIGMNMAMNIGMVK